MTWNKRYEQFALSCAITRLSTTLLLRWVLRRAKQNGVIELLIDLRNFNTWVAKFRGKPFDPKTLKTAIAQLDEQSEGLVIMTKQYSPWVMKILVRPLSFVLEKKFRKEGKIPKLPTLNPMFDAEHKKNVYKQQQQNISRLDSLFREIGMSYTPDALERIWRLAHKDYDEIVDAVQLLLHRHSTQSKPIPNPCGWLIDCLKFGWHFDSELVQSPLLPSFDTISALVEDCNRLRKIPLPPI